jgi:hypothetical protein
MHLGGGLINVQIETKANIKITAFHVSFRKSWGILANQRINLIGNCLDMLGNIADRG